VVTSTSAASVAIGVMVITVHAATETQEAAVDDTERLRRLGIAA